MTEVSRLGRAVRRPALRSPVFLLTSAYVALVALYGWQAAERQTVTLFSDEIELTQLSRAIAETGEAALRAGAEPLGFPGLSAWLIAPWWWIDDVGVAYGGIKLTGVAVMTAVIVPTYLLGRLVLRPGWAVAAAIGAAAVPALAYAPFLVKEPLAYPTSALALLLAVRAVVKPTIGRWAAALAMATAGWLVRSQLAVLFFVLTVAALFLVWDSARFRRWRSSWTRGDWIGAAVLALGAVVAANALISHNSLSWYTTTAFFKGRLLDYSISAAGAFVIGVGLLPVIAGVASLGRRPSRSTREERALAVVTGVSIVAFVFYAGIKGAYLSTVFANLIVERNVIYLAPLLFVGAALVLSKRDTPIWAIVAAGGTVLTLVVAAPYSLATFPNYEAHGLAITAFANRVLRWPEGTIQSALVIAVVVAIVALAALRLLRDGTVARALAAGCACLVLAWSLSGEIYAAHGENIAAEREYSTLPKPADWLDRTLPPGATAVFLGQRVGAVNPLYQLEFWNRSLDELWSLDATAPPPGRVTTPDIAKPDGTLNTRPGYGARFVVAGQGVDLAATPLGAPAGEYRVYPTAPDGRIRLATARSGVYPDGWMSSAAQYTQYSVPAASRQLARVLLSREAWCGEDVPGRVRIRLGPIGVTKNLREYITHVTSQASWTIHSCKGRGFVLRTPRAPWRVEVEISPTFSPRELDPGQGDARQLGARVDFSTVSLGS